MTEPVQPPLTLEDLYPDLANLAPGGPPGALIPGWPRIVAAGEDSSTIKYDHTSSVRDSRTPDMWKPVERILADQLGRDPNSLRLVRGYTTDAGAVTLWEVLNVGGDVEEYCLASYSAGGDRLHLAYAKTLTIAEGRLAQARAALTDLEVDHRGG